MKKESLLKLKIKVSFLTIFILSLFFAPWYFTFTLLISFVVIYTFMEALLYGFVLDLLWSPKDPFFYRFKFFFIILAIFLLVRFLRRFIRTNTI